MNMYFFYFERKSIFNIRKDSMKYIVPEEVPTKR